MEKIDKIIKILRENMMVGGVTPTNNISGGKVALFDPLIKFGNKNKKDTVDFRRVPPKFKEWVKYIRK
jgi:hypothetical protein